MANPQDETDYRPDRGTTGPMIESRSTTRPPSGASVDLEKSELPFKVADPIDKPAPDGRTALAQSRGLAAKPSRASGTKAVIGASQRRDISVAEAIRLNKRAAKELGWIDQNAFDKIAHFLGFIEMTPSEEALVIAVRNWQKSRNLPPDGVIVGQTWVDLRTILEIPGSALPVFRQLNWAHEQNGIRIFGTRSGSPPQEQWGRSEVIASLERVGWDWFNDPHNNGGPSNRETVAKSLIVPGDLGMAFGGPLKPHKSHDIGLDADIYTTLLETNIRSSAYSLVKALAIAEVFFRNGALLIGFKAYKGGEPMHKDQAQQRVFTDRFGVVPPDKLARNGKPYGKNYPRVAAWHGHEDHFHVRWAVETP